jgi:hypothetical protein
MIKKLKARIYETHEKQWKFARAVDCQETIVSEVIHGRRKLAEPELRRWAVALDMSSADLLKIISLDDAK